MEVASTIDGGRLAVVVEKMMELLDSLEASVVEDEANEQISQQNYVALVNDLETTLTEVDNALNTAQSDLEQAKSKLRSQEAFLEENQMDLQAAQDGKEAKKEQCALWSATYEETKESR